MTELTVFVFLKGYRRVRSGGRIYIPVYMESIKLSQLSLAGRTMLCLKRSMG